MNLHEFTKWTGGKNPAKGCLVHVVYRGSNVPATALYQADKLDWSKMDSGPQIVAYKIMQNKEAE